jgi:hypothetical protein
VSDPTCFEQLDDYGNARLILTMAGKQYAIPDVNPIVGRKVMRMLAVGVKVAEGQEMTDADRDQFVLDDEEEAALLAEILGPALDQMTADGVGWRRLQHVLQTAMVWIAQGPSRAALIWGSWGAEVTPKAPQDRRRRSARTATS